MSGNFSSTPPPPPERVPPGQYLTRGFPVLTYGSTPQITPEAWCLRLWGLVTERVVRRADLMALPQRHFTADFHCVTTWSKLDVQWQGVSIPDLLQGSTIAPEAAHVMIHCEGGYTTNLALADFVRSENFLAHQLFGEPLPPDHGGPVRLVVPHLYAWKSAKWITGIEFLAEQQLGFWERNGYHHRGEPWAEERYSLD